MGKACSTYGDMRKLEMHTTFWLVSLKIRDHSEDLGIDGRKILK
jgi:hypothetical protein